MKILLVSPSQFRVYGKFSAPAFPSLSLGYLATVLEKAGHQVRIIDIDAEKMSGQDFVKELINENFGLVGITTSTPTFNEAIYLADVVKGNSKAFTVLGGVHVSVMPDEAIKYKSVDFVVKGEGERTIVELAECLEGRKDLETVDGLYYRQDGKIVKNKDRELISDLDAIPFPARHLYKNNIYTYPDTLTTPVFPIVTSRGCPAHCSYCATNSIFKHKFRARSPKNVVDELELLVKDFKAKEIHVWDDNFIFIKSRIIEIKDEIKKRSLKLKFAFPDGVRVDCVDEELLKALKEMGTYSIAFGIESGSQYTLNKVNKGLRLGRVEEVFRLARRLGMEIWAFFIIGLPDENEKRIKETIAFAKKINPDVAKFHILKPYPGTRVYDEFLANSLIIDHNFDNYGIHTPPVHRLKDLTADQILYWQRRAYKSFYLRPSILMRHVCRLKSINRLKSNFIIGKDILLKSLIKR